MARMTRPSPTFKPPAGRHETESASAEAAQTRAEQPELTTRQADVIELAMTCREFWLLGLTNSQIAQRLNLSTHAIKFNLSAAYRKLAVANRTQAAVAYLNYRAEDRH
jgi:DNA-binding NarL/FixJ family response regulator